MPELNISKILKSNGVNNKNRKIKIKKSNKDKKKMLMLNRL